MSANDSTAALAERWPAISALLAKAGHITIGCIPPVDGAAIAADGQKLLATIVRREDESFDELLHRLDRAIDRALSEGVATNEIKGGHFMLAAPRPKKTVQ